MAKKKVAPKKTTSKNNTQTNKKVSSKSTVNKNTKTNTNRGAKKEAVQKEVSKAVKIVKLCIALLIVCVLLYYVYVNFIVIKDNISKEGNISTSEVEELAKQKFLLLNSKHNITDNDLMFFTSDNLDIKTIDNKYILYFAYSMLSIEDKNIVKECEDKTKKDCYKESFGTKVLEEQIHNYFDIDEVHHEDFNAASSIVCKLIDERYECTQENTNYIISPYNTISTYSSSKLAKDKLIVKSTLLTVRRNKDKNYAEGIYSDVKATKKIDDLTYFLNDLQGIISNENSEKLSKKYEKEITQYETTFVLKNKNYVWQSTKIIK